MSPPIPIPDDAPVITGMVPLHVEIPHWVRDNPSDLAVVIAEATRAQHEANEAMWAVLGINTALEGQYSALLQAKDDGAHSIRLAHEDALFGIHGIYTVKHWARDQIFAKRDELIGRINQTKQEILEAIDRAKATAINAIRAAKENPDGQRSGNADDDSINRSSNHEIQKC